jgi:hypothetical protein
MQKEFETTRDLTIRMQSQQSVFMLRPWRTEYNARKLYGNWTINSESLFPGWMPQLSTWPGRLFPIPVIYGSDCAI